MRLGNKMGNWKIKIGKHTFKEVKQFKYLGVMFSNDWRTEDEIKNKMMAINRAFPVNKKKY